MKNASLNCQFYERFIRLAHFLLLYTHSTNRIITPYVLQMLGILVSFVDDDGRVKVEFLEAISLVTVDSESVCKAILNVLAK